MLVSIQTLPLTGKNLQYRFETVFDGKNESVSNDLELVMGKNQISFLIM